MIGVDETRWRMLSDKGKVVPINVLTETGLRQGETALVRNDKRVAALIPASGWSV